MKEFGPSQDREGRAIREMLLYRGRGPSGSGFRPVRAALLRALATVTDDFESIRQAADASTSADDDTWRAYMYGEHGLADDWFREFSGPMLARLAPGIGGPLRMAFDNAMLEFAGFFIPEACKLLAQDLRTKPKFLKAKGSAVKQIARDCFVFQVCPKAQIFAGLTVLGYPQVSGAQAADLPHYLGALDAFAQAIEAAAGDRATALEMLCKGDLAIGLSVVLEELRLRKAENSVTAAAFAPQARALVKTVRESAAEGNNQSKVRLADMFIDGDGLPVDGKQAVRLLEAAEAEDYDWARGELIALLSLLPQPNYALDAENYIWDGATPEQSHQAQLQDVNVTLAWAQIVGLLDAPIQEDLSLQARLVRLNGINSPDLDRILPKLQAMHERARTLLTKQIDLAEARPEDSWLLGEIRVDSGLPLLEALYSEGQAAILPVTKLTAKDRQTRNRLLLLEARRSADYNPDGPKVYFQDGRSEPMSTKVLQTYLQKVGFRPGTVDGQMGPSTRHALASFQRALGLDATGQPDAVTLFALQIANWAGFTF